MGSFPYPKFRSRWQSHVERCSNKIVVWFAVYLNCYFYFLTVTPNRDVVFIYLALILWLWKSMNIILKSWDNNQRTLKICLSHFSHFSFLISKLRSLNEFQIKYKAPLTLYLRTHKSFPYILCIQGEDCSLNSLLLLLTKR